MRSKIFDKNPIMIFINIINLGGPGDVHRRHPEYAKHDGRCRPHDHGLHGLIRDGGSLAVHQPLALAQRQRRVIGGCAQHPSPQ